MRQLTEADWKVFRKLYKVAHDRFAQRTVTDVQRLAAHPDRSPHERFRAICKLVQRRNQYFTDVFHRPRRSTAFLTLLGIYNMAILTPEEMAEFSPEMRETLHALLGNPIAWMGSALELLDDFEDHEDQ